MIPLAAVFPSGTVGTVTVTGATISDTDAAPNNPIARLEFRTDGTVWKTEGTTETQLSSTTDWIDPAVGVAKHQIRRTNLTGDTGSATAAVDAWHSFADGEYFVQYTRLTEGFNSGTFDIEIRLGSGAVKDSGSYTMTATKAA